MHSAGDYIARDSVAVETVVNKTRVPSIGRDSVTCSWGQVDVPGAEGRGEASVCNAMQAADSIST